jgi:hypothetical protein
MLINPANPLQRAGRKRGSSVQDMFIEIKVEMRKSQKRWLFGDFRRCDLKINFAWS